MPVMDGFTATGKIRAGAAGMDKTAVPIVAMTANAVSGDRERCLAAGMNDYLAKPIGIDALRAMLVRWLGQGGDDVEPKVRALPGRPREVPVFDSAELLANCANDQALVDTLIDAALIDIPRQLAMLDSALTRHAQGDVRTAAHTLKGLAAQLSGKRMAEAARKVEALAREGKWPSQQEVAAIVEEFDHLKETLQKYKTA